MKISLILPVLFILIQAIMSCAPKHSVQANFFENNRKQTLPDSARVKATISITQNNATEKLSAVLFTVPNKKYRFELSAMFGLSAASILWKDDSWKIVFPQEERYMEGEGNCIFIPNYGNVDIHKFSLLFLGQKIDELSCNKNELDNLKAEYIENFALFSFGSDTLKLEIKDINTKSTWNNNIWNLNIPEKYIKVVQ